MMDSKCFTLFLDLLEITPGLILCVEITLKHLRKLTILFVYFAEIVRIVTAVSIVLTALIVVPVTIVNSVMIVSHVNTV